MKTANVLSHEKADSLETEPDTIADFSLWPTADEEVAAEAMLARCQVEEELERLWFDCFIALAEHHQNRRLGYPQDQVVASQLC